MTGQQSEALNALEKARREFEKARRTLEDVSNRETPGKAGQKEVDAALLALMDAGDRMERARQRAIR